MEAERDETVTASEQLIVQFNTYLKATDGEALKQLGNDLLERCDYQVLNFMEHEFSPHGYTCIWLLGESHLAIHTFPEKQLSYLELSSCNPEKNENFQGILKREFSHLIP